jgi:Dolichyl-phosphate-mannose-protein mannosyltransferase
VQPEQTRELGKWDAASVALLWALYGGACFWVSRDAEFPINDDWAYSLPLASVHEIGKLRLSNFQSMPLLPQLAWGGLFTLPFGFSFTALRLSTQVLGGLGLAALYLLLRQLSGSKRWAWVGALSVLANPLFFASANSFMTDVPFLSLEIVAIALLHRALNSASAKHSVQGFFVLLAATLVRQLGVTIGAAYCLASAVRHGVNRKWMVGSLMPALLVALSLPLCRWLIASTVGLPGLYDARNAGVTATLLGMLKGQIPVRMFIDRGWLTMAVLALSLLPVVSLGLGSVRGSTFGRRGWATLGLASLGLLGLANVALAFPQVSYTGHLFLGTGIGPSTLPGPPGFSISKGLQFAFNATALAASVALILIVAERVTAARAAAAASGTWWAWLTPTQIVCLAGALASLGLMYVARGPYFDRHILAAIPLFVIALAVGAKAPSPRAFAAVCAVLLGVFGWSAAATHDLFAWNRVRWQTGQELTQTRIALSDLDAGFEFNNLVGNLRLLRDTGAFSTRTIKGHACSYALQFAAREGERTLEEYPVRTWLASSPQRLVLVERNRTPVP